MRFPPFRTWWGRVCLGGLWFWAAVFATRFWDHKIILGDEGVAVMGAWRILDGQVPGRDFFEIIPPFSFLPTALAFKMFGLDLAAERGVSLLLAGLLMFLVDRLLARTGSPLPARALALALLVPFGVLYWPVASHHWWVDVLQLGAAFLLLGIHRSRRPTPVAGAAGVLCGLALFTLQDQGALFLLALGFLFWLPSRKEPWFFKGLLAWGAGLGAAAIPFLGWLVPTAGLKNLWVGWAVFPLTGYRELPGHQLNLLAGWQEISALWSTGAWTGAPVYVALLSACAIVLLLLPISAGVALLAFLRRKGPGRGQAGILGALALAFLGTALHRWSLTNAVWATPGLLAALGAAFAGRGERKDPRPIPAWVSGGFATLTVLFLAFGIGFYRLGVAAVPVEARAGTLLSLARGEAQDLSHLLSAVEELVPRGEPLFCVGFHSMVNFLSQRPNPTRYNVFIRPHYNFLWQSEEVSRQLASGRIRWVCAGRSRIPPPEDPTGQVLRARFAPRFQNARFVLLQWVPPPSEDVRP